MKILFITTKNNHYQGDYFELTILNGLREILGNNCVDYPRKDIAYHDFSKIKKKNLHGQGFTLLNRAIDDIANRNQVFEDNEFDFVLYGCGHAYGEDVFVDDIDAYAKYGSWVLDGHDLYGDAPQKNVYNSEEIISNQYPFSFKREMVFNEKNIYPSGFGIPEHLIKPLDFKCKNQVFQKTYPKYSFFENPTDLGGNKNHHLFTNEDDYFSDLSKSWFGLSCKKGGWDSLRNYEIIASGTLLLYRDYKNKPKLCSPQALPALSYSSEKQLNNLTKRLVENNQPSSEYIRILQAQREWLYRFGTTKARAAHILQVLSDVKKSYLIN